MIPINILSYEANKQDYFSNNDISSLKLPLGADPAQFSTKRGDNSFFEEIQSKLYYACEYEIERIQKKTYCFYCGSPSHDYVPAHMHDATGFNLWLNLDWRSASIICPTCKENAGDYYVNYNRKVNDTNNFINLLSFEPNILLPSLEPVHEHYRISSSFRLMPLSSRAEYTIKLFALNRSELIERRHKSFTCFSEYVNDNRLDQTFPRNINAFDLIQFSHEAMKDDEKTLLASDSLLFNDELLFHDSHLTKRMIDRALKFEFLTENPIYVPPNENLKQYHKNICFNKIKNNIREYKHDTYFPGVKDITFNGIRNFSQNQNISFNGKNSIIIIGENGVGKSTLINLIKFSLQKSQSKSLEKLVNQSNLLPYVKVNYNSHESTFSCNFNSSNRRFENYGRRENCKFIDISESRTSAQTIISLTNLIVKHKDNSDFINWISIKLKTLLSLPQEYNLTFRNNHIYFKNRHIHKKAVSLDKMSSGYRSILIIFYKIIKTFEYFEDNILSNLKHHLSNTIVAIDEIELHLHPKFKKEIVKNFKLAFPEVLLIATTHDPLVLKSADSNTNVFVLESDGDKTTIRKKLPEYRNLTTEQILTSPIFGLETLDSEVIQEDIVEKYYQNIRNKNWQEVNATRDLLGKKGYFGNTYRELIALSAVDAYLSNGEIPKVEDIINVLHKMDRNEKN